MPRPSNRSGDQTPGDKKRRHKLSDQSPEQVEKNKRKRRKKLRAKLGLARVLEHVAKAQESEMIQDFGMIYERLTAISATLSGPDVLMDEATNLFQGFMHKALERNHRQLRGVLSFGLGTFLDAQDPDMLAVVKAGGRRKGLADLTNRDAVFKAIAGWREEGLNPKQFAPELADLIGRGRFRSPITRAKLIARTETMHAQRQAALTAYQSRGITRCRLIDGRHRNADAECKARNGKIVPISEAQRYMDAEHPNGTLSYAPIIDAPLPPMSDEQRAQAEANLEGLPTALQAKIKRLKGG